MQQTHCQFCLEFREIFFLRIPFSAGKRPRSRDYAHYRDITVREFYNATVYPITKKPSFSI